MSEIVDESFSKVTLAVEEEYADARATLLQKVNSAKETAAASLK